MPERLVHSGFISLNSEQYKLKEPIRPRLINKYAPKIVTGETTGDSQVGRSRIEWSDNRGGIGVDRITDLEAANAISLDRSWYSSAYLRHKGHLTLPPLPTTTAAPDLTGIFTVGAMAEFSDKVYAAFSDKVYVYDFAADSWGSAIHTLSSPATDAITLRLAGTVYMVFAYSSGNAYTSGAGTSWANDDGDDVQYLAAWDDRLWGIDSTGQLRFCQTIGTWTNDAILPLPSTYVTDLYVDRDAGGEPILYAATKVGLYAHDAANARFLKTELDLPFHDDAGRGVTRWRGAAYYPAGLGVYRYQAGPSASVAVVGPDRDDGVPDDRRGTIVRLEQSHNELLALVDSTSAAATTFDMFTAAEDNAAHVVEAEVGVSTILGWDMRGWQVLWESSANTEAITYSLVSNAYGGYRLWWSHNRLVHYMELPVDIVNPSETSDRNYASSATHDLPWLVVGQETAGLALRLRVQVADSSSNETVTPSYAVNFSESFTALTAITSDGTTTYDFPDSTTPTGTAFRAFRPRLALARGSNTLLSPDVVSVTLEWRKKLPAQYAWSVVLDLSERHGSRSPMQQRADLTTATASNALVEFTFRDDTGDDRNYYVDVVEHGGLEFTGHDERGVVELLLAEV